MDPPGEWRRVTTVWIGAARNQSVLPKGHLAKYARQLGSIGLSSSEYAETYSQVIRIVPERALGWHGRTQPGSACLAVRAPAFAGA